MAVPDTDDYIGNYLRIETPFESQNYDSATNCISKWTLLVPSDNPDQAEDPMQLVRAPFAEWINRFSNWKDHAVVYSNLVDFAKWLRGDKSKASSNGVLILSHHDSDRIYFEDPPGQTIEYTNVMRAFASPSLVILNGCGTAKPGASNFLRAFNRDGVATALATSYAVDARMAGLFAQQLMEALAANVDDVKYNVSLAKFDAMKKVSNLPIPDQQGKLWGPRALVFTLVGNGGVRACTPPPVSSTPQ
jgi:hypothetical protein